MKPPVRLPAPSGAILCVVLPRPVSAVGAATVRESAGSFILLLFHALYLHFFPATENSFPGISSLKPRIFHVAS
jgi:hypothetical protein